MLCHLAAGSVHSLLRGGDGVHGGHQTLQDTKVVVDHLGKRRQAVCSAGSVAHNLERNTTVLSRPALVTWTNLHVLVVGLLVDAHDEHRGVSRGGGDDDLLGAALVVSSGLRMAQ